MTERAGLCAANNADLYQAVFRAHGLPDWRDGTAWWSDAIAPPYYSNLTTLDPEGGGEQLARIEGLKSSLPGPFSVKDGFRRLDLASHGFGLLFEASWIWAEPSTGHVPAAWHPVADASALEAWESAWSASSPSSQRVFPPAILQDEAITVFGRTSVSGFDAGCIANRSADVVGLSNVFAVNGDLTRVYPDAACAVSSTAPGRPVVGYERGNELDIALRSGFEIVGDLRIWLLENAT